MSSKARSFVGGAAILAVAGLLGKIIGAFYRVWLNELIGPQGLGIYQIPYSFYAFLLVISTAGIPTAISKLVSKCEASGDEEGTRRVFSVAKRILVVTGTLTTVLMAVFAKPLAQGAGNPDAALGFVMLAPSLFIVCMLSAYRGYFQGKQMMTPSAISQIIEQIGRLVFGFGLAILWYPKGALYGAAGAVLGVTLCEACALVFIYGSYRAHISGKPIRPSKFDSKPVLVDLVKIALPVTLGASIMPLVSLTDTMTVINRLVSIGYEAKAATSTFGILNGMVTSIVNMPAVISLSLSISLVPAISAAMEQGRREYTGKIAYTGMKLAALIGFPCAVGIFLLASPILDLLSSTYTPEQHEIAVRLLKIMAFAIIFLTMTQTTTGMLQGLSKPLLPVYSLGIGAVIKIALNYTLIAIPSVNIAGAAIGSLVCYAIASVINIWNVKKHAGMKFSFVKQIALPAISALIMGLAVYFVNLLLEDILGQTLSMFACIGVGVIVYAVMIFVLGAVTKDDLDWIPKGHKLKKLLRY